MIEFIINAFNNSVIGIPLITVIILGILTAVLGVFTVLRRQALIGDALSHASLPGVVLMYIIVRSESMLVLVIGAFISASISMFLMNVIKKYSKIENDALLALILSSFFGLGTFLINLVNDSKIGLNNFIFGSAATVVRNDLKVVTVVAIIVLAIIYLLWNHIKVQTFDESFYQSLGYSPRVINLIFSFMTILVIVVGIKTVGVILMSSLLIVPAISARMWSNKLHINVFIASLIGFISAFLGTYFSFNLTTPIGPMIVIIGTSIAVLSILFAPKRGLLSKEILRIKYKNSIYKYKDLIHIYEGNSVSKEDRRLHLLVNEGKLTLNNDEYILTNEGIKTVENILKVGER